MGLHPVYGHEKLLEKLGRSFRQDRLPPVLLLVGPAGVGKQRIALWLGQLALCEARDPAPCGRCRSCQRALDLTHADLHWFIPIPRPKAAEPDKQIQEARELVGELVAERRKTSLYQPPDGLASHGVASARLILRTAVLSAVEGGTRVFIIGDADRLVPQEANQEAANALLKFLEEPPVRSLTILTAPDPRRVLPTIRSRAATVRVGPVPAPVVNQFLTDQLPAVPAADRELRVRSADGAIGRALAADQAHAARRTAVRELLAAATGAPAERFERALKQFPSQARGDFTTLLDSLMAALRDAARAATGTAPVEAVVPELARSTNPAALLRAIAAVDAARTLAQGNVNPQLLLAAVSQDLAEVL